MRFFLWIMTIFFSFEAVLATDESQDLAPIPFTPIFPVSTSHIKHDYGIIFKEKSDLFIDYPYLKDLKVTFLPFVGLSNARNELTKDDLGRFNIIVENEYAVIDGFQKKSLATIGIYDCIALVIPQENLMMHIHEKTNLESVKEALSKYSTQNIFLYTASITPFLRSFIKDAFPPEIEKDLINLCVRPMACEAVDSNSFDPFKYLYSYDGGAIRGTNIFMPQRLFFYTTEETQKTVVIESYLQNYLIYLTNISTACVSKTPDVLFITDMRSPLNLFLTEEKTCFFEINLDVLRSVQDNIYEKRNSLGDNRVSGKISIQNVNFE